MTRTPETTYELIEQLQRQKADLLAALRLALPILGVAHDRGMAIGEVEPAYNAAWAAIAKAEGK